MGKTPGLHRHPRLRLRLPYFAVSKLLCLIGNVRESLMYQKELRYTPGMYTPSQTMGKAFQECISLPCSFKLFPMAVFLQRVISLIRKIHWISFQCVFGLSVIIRKIWDCIYSNEKWVGCILVFRRGSHCLCCSGLLCSFDGFGVAGRVAWEKWKVSGSLVPRELSLQSMGSSPKPSLCVPSGGAPMPTSSCALGVVGHAVCLVIRFSEPVGALHSWCGPCSSEGACGYGSPSWAGSPGCRHLLGEQFFKMCFLGF